MIKVGFLVRKVRFFVQAKRGFLCVTVGFLVRKGGDFCAGLGAGAATVVHSPVQTLHGAPVLRAAGKSRVPR